MPTIQTRTFSFTVRDVVEAALDFTQPQRRRRRLILAAAFGAALAFVACPVLIVQVFMPEYAEWVWRDFLLALEAHKPALGLLASAILLGVLGQPLLWRYGIRRGMQDNRDQYRDLSVTFGADGIDFTWPNAALHNAWDFYQQVIESKEYFLLVYGSLYVAVPKRAVPDVAALAALLRQHIPAYAERAPDHWGRAGIAS